MLTLLAVATGVTLGALVAHGTYYRLVAGVDDRLLANRWAFLGFLPSLVLVPLSLVAASQVAG